MVRTNNKARGGGSRRNDHGGNTKTGESRKQQNKKLNQQSRKATKAAKRAETTGTDNAPPQNPPKDPADDTARIEESNDSLQPEPSAPSTTHPSNAPSSTNNTTNISIPPDLLNSHEITTMSIISSSHIQQKVTRALSLLSTYPAVPPVKAVVIVLYAKAKAAAKAISIAEIVKREIGKEGGKWFQYNWVNGLMEEQKRESSNGERKGKGKAQGEDEEMMDGDGSEEEEEEAFETMKTPFERAIEGSVKVRAVPVMMIYLSRVRIESLRRDYGEQTNGQELPQ